MKFSNRSRLARLGLALLSELSKESIVLSFGRPTTKTVASVTLSVAPADDTARVEVILSTPQRPWGPLSYQALSLTVGLPRSEDGELPF